MEYVVYACILLTLIAATAVIVNWRMSPKYRRWRLGRQRAAMCIRCQGKGWTTQRVRTLTFTGDGFADVDPPATMCQTCGGTGHVTR